MVQFSQPYMKDHNLAIQTCVSKAMSLFFNTLSRFVKAFLLRSNRLLIPRLQLPSAVIFEPKKRKSVTVSIFSPSICHEVIGLDAMILGFLLLLFSFRQAFSLFSSSRGSLVPLSFLTLEWYQPHTGEGNGNPLQYSCLENPVDRGAWWAAVHRVTQSWTRLKQLSMLACIGEGNGNPLQYSCLEDPRDRGDWWAAVYGVTRRWRRLKRRRSSSISIPISEVIDVSPGNLDSSL